MSEMNATPATEAATSETQDFLSSVGESEKRVRVSGKAVSDEVVISDQGRQRVLWRPPMRCTIRRSTSDKGEIDGAQSGLRAAATSTVLAKPQP